MRFFIFFVTTLTFVISANASINEKRELTFAFQTCERQITDDMQVKMISDFTDTIKNAAPDSILYRGSPSTVFTTKLASAIRYCCKKAAPNMKGEDFNELPNFLSSMINDFDNFVSVAVSKQAVINANYLNANKVIDFSNDILTRIEYLLACFKPNDPTYLNELRNSHSKLKGVYQYDYRSYSSKSPA